MQVITLNGRAGKDAEEKSTRSGQKGVFFPFAVSIYTGGEEATVWYEISVWNADLFKTALNVKKGSFLTIVGPLGEIKTYMSKAGDPKAALKVKASFISFLPKKKADETIRNLI